MGRIVATLALVVVPRRSDYAQVLAVSTVVDLGPALWASAHAVFSFIGPVLVCASVVPAFFTNFVSADLRSFRWAL